jgi:hypothetical protein
MSDKITEKELVDWANTRVLSKYQINSFQDIDSMKDGLYVLSLLDSFRPSVVDWKLVHSNLNDKEINCRYCLEIARSLEIPVLVEWSDIAYVDRNMLKMFFVAV